MINATYRLVAPRRFEPQFTNMELLKNEIIVRPTHLSICVADQRYYQGTRGPEIIKEKLPMALIHEAIGKVVYDSEDNFKADEYVVMIPNSPVENDPIIAENYLRSSKFRASSSDGFMQDYVALSRDRVVKLPDEVNKDVAAFTELVTVSYHAIDRFEKMSHERRKVVGVWGDGNLAYITSLLLKTIYPEMEVLIFGLSEYKMADFVFVDKTYDISDIPPELKVDHAFECVGGMASSKAINQIIDYINPEGTISILGVSEELVPLNTRMILEKGLRLFGTSRSGRKDFENVVKLYQEHKEIVEYLSKIINKTIDVFSIDDMNKAFEEDIHKPIGKTVMRWKK